MVEDNNSSAATPAAFKAMPHFFGGTTFGVPTSSTGSQFGASSQATDSGLFGQTSSTFGTSASTGAFGVSSTSNTKSAPTIVLQTSRLPICSTESHFGANTQTTYSGLFGQTSFTFRTPASSGAFGVSSASNTKSTPNIIFPTSQVPISNSGSHFGANTQTTDSCLYEQTSFTFRTPASTGAFGDFSTTPPTGTTIKFNAPVGSDTMMKKGVTTDIKTQYQCITYMEEYENKSLEELRLEDYADNRKGRAAGTNSAPAFSTVGATGGVTQQTGNVFGTFRAPAFTTMGTTHQIKNMFGTIAAPVFNPVSTTGYITHQTGNTFGTNAASPFSTTGGTSQWYHSSPLSTHLHSSGTTHQTSNTFGAIAAPVFSSVATSEGTTQQTGNTFGTIAASGFSNTGTPGGTTQQTEDMFGTFSSPAFTTMCSTRGTTTADSLSAFSFGSSTQSKSCFNSKRTRNFIVKTSTGATVKLKVPLGYDTNIVINRIETSVETRQECITSMVDYGDKSLEELRMEDNVMLRKAAASRKSILKRKKKKAVSKRPKESPSSVKISTQTESETSDSKTSKESPDTVKISTQTESETSDAKTSKESPDLVKTSTQTESETSDSKTTKESPNSVNISTQAQSETSDSETSKESPTSLKVSIQTQLQSSDSETSKESPTSKVSTQTQLQSCPETCAKSVFLRGVPFKQTHIPIYPKLQSDSGSETHEKTSKNQTNIYFESSCVSSAAIKPKRWVNPLPDLEDCLLDTFTDCDAMTQSNSVQLVVSNLPLSEASNWEELKGVFLFRQIISSCDKTLRCVLCENKCSLRFLEDLEKHYRDIHDLTVTIRQAEFKENLVFVCMPSDVDEGDTYTVPCSFCDTTLKSLNEISCHYLDVHNKAVKFMQASDVLGIDNFVYCGLCGHASEDFEIHDRHMKVEHGLQEYPCRFCEFCTPRPSHLRIHVKQEHRSQCRYMCPECYKYVIGRHVLMKHMLSHEQPTDSTMLKASPNFIKASIETQSEFYILVSLFVCVLWPLFALGISEFCTYLVFVKGVAFRLNKDILSTCAPLFLFKLEHEMRETGIVSLDNCDIDTFKAFISYIYTQKMDHLHSNNIYGVLTLASKYEETELKLLCLAMIKSTLSTDTFFDMLDFALTHDNKDLLELADDFISADREVMKNPKWMNLLTRKCMESVEMLTKVLLWLAALNKGASV